MTPVSSCSPGHWKIAFIIAYMALLAALSLVPMDPGATHFRVLLEIKPHIQNLMHIPTYALLAVLWMQVLSNRGHTGLSRLSLAIVLSAGFGLANEAAQALIPGRYPGLTDALANLIGTGTGVLIFLGAERSAPGWIRRLICT